MFNDLPGFWMPAAFSKDLTHRPRQVQVAGEKIVLFRGAGGQTGALLDRCPHRGVALSLGKVTPEGCLECPFHGWAFDTSGNCAHVPFNPDAPRHRLGAVRIPVREKGGFLWVFTDPNVENPGEPDVPEMLLSSAFLDTTEVIWKCHWTRAMENMLDFPHVPYVHRRSIGRGLRKAREMKNLALDLEFQRTSFGFRVNTTFGGTDKGGGLEWHKPNGMVLYISEKPFTLRGHVFCVPGAPGETRMMSVMAQDLPRALRPVARLLLPLAPDVLGEDQPVVESSYPVEVPLDSTEVSVATDQPTLYFRAWYARHKRAWERSQTGAGSDSDSPETRERKNSASAAV